MGGHEKLLAWVNNFSIELRSLHSCKKKLYQAVPFPSDQLSY
jgi:hypothetical protein